MFPKKESNLTYLKAAFKAQNSLHKGFGSRTKQLYILNPKTPTQHSFKTQQITNSNRTNSKHNPIQKEQTPKLFPPFIHVSSIVTEKRMRCKNCTQEHLIKPIRHSFCTKVESKRIKNEALFLISELMAKEQNVIGI